MSASSSQQSQPSLQPLSSQQPLTSQQSRRNSTDSHQTSLSTSTYFDMENAFEKTIASKSLSPFLSMSLNSKDSNNNKIRNSWISSVSQLSSNIPFTIPHIEVYVEKCENLPAMSSSGFCDPYVVLSVIPLGDNELRDFSQIPSEESCKSSKIKKTLNPVWNGKERFFLGFPGLVNNANNYFSNSVSQSFNSKKQSQTKNTSISFNENKSKSTDSLLSATTTMTAATTSSKNATHHSLTHFQNKNYYLLIQVFSYDRLKKDSFIGSARIGPLSKLPYGVMLSKTVSLHEAGTSATCSIKFIAHNFGLTWEEFEEMDSNGNDEFLTFKPVCADPVKAVLDKISNSRYANQFPNPKDELRFATMLADKSHLLQTYLNKDWVEIIPTTHSHKQQIMIQPNSSETSPRASNPHSQNHSHQQNSMSGSNTSNNLDATAASSSSPLHNELMHSTPTPSHGTVGSSVLSGEECSHHSLTQLNHHEMNSSGGRIRNRTTITSSSTMTTTNNVSFHPVIMNESSNNNNNNQMNNTSVPQRSPHAFDEDHQDHEEEDEDNEHDNHHEDADEEDTESTDGSESEEDEETEEEKQVMNEFIEEQKKQLLKGKVDIKLIIVDQERDQKLKSSARKLLSPILSKFSSSISSFGMFHSSILIGNWILEWNDSALCVPRRTLSKAALFCADLEPITTLEDLDVVINKLADVIVEWNTTKKYKPMGGNRCIYGNCQDFCEAVLARIGVDFRIKNPYVRHFFEQLKKKGSTDLKLYFQKEEAEVPNSFANKFKLLSASGGSNSIKFATHEQLDQFVLRCLRIDPEMKTNYPDVWSLLKGFDRAFWLRHLAWEEMKEKKRRELVSVERNLFKISQLRRAKKLTDEDVLTENRLFERANEIKKEFERIEKEGKPVRPFMGKQLDERKELVEVDLCPFSNPLTTYSIRLYH